MTTGSTDHTTDCTTTSSSSGKGKGREKLKPNPESAAANHTSSPQHSSSISSGVKTPNRRQPGDSGSPGPAKKMVHLLSLYLGPSHCKLVAPSPLPPCLREARRASDRTGSEPLPLHHCLRRQVEPHKTAPSLPIRGGMWSCPPPPPPPLLIRESSRASRHVRSPRTA